MVPAGRKALSKFPCALHTAPSPQLFMLASGEVFGRDQPVALQLLGSERSREALEGVAMELEDRWGLRGSEGVCLGCWVLKGCAGCGLLREMAVQQMDGLRREAGDRLGAQQS